MLSVVTVEVSASTPCAAGLSELSTWAGLLGFAEAAPAVALVIARLSPSQTISEPAFAQLLGKTIIQGRGILQFIDRTDV